MRYRTDMRNFTIILLLTAALVTGCSKDGSSSASGESGAIAFSMKTKDGSAASATYRMVLFGYNAVSSTYSARSQGSYRDKDAKDWMTPCRVDPATGEWMEDGSVYGLRSTYNGDYMLSIVTPARQPDYLVTEPNSSVRGWGYNLERTGDALLVSSPVKVTVTGNHLNRKYVYQADASLLRDCRSKLTVKLQCGDDLTSVHVNKLTIRNFYSAMSYDFGSDSLVNPTLDAVGLVMHDTTDPEIELLHGEPAEEVFSDFYLFSLNYDKIDDEYHFVYDVPQLEVTIGSGVVSVPLHYEFKPQHTYTYTLSINSAFVKMSVTALPWNDLSGSLEETIGEPKTEVFTFDPGTWDLVDGGSGTI